MFATLKKELNIVEVVSYITETEYKLTGENTYIPEDDVCPSCGHKNCFRIKYTGDNEEAFAKCFSENFIHDVVGITALLKEISNVDAAKLLAKHYNIKLPNNYSPVQEVFNLATDYYHNLLLTSGPFAELSGLTPLEFQLQVRQHSEESLNTFKIGWSDGKLIEHLDSLGIDKEIIQASGLAGKKSGDYLPARTFIYSHFIRGRTSHLDFKDPLRLKAYQLPNKYKLNEYCFYNSDSISKTGPVAIVEGANDVISLLEAGWDSGAIATCGSISGSQFEWMVINLKGRDVVTFYDSDPAGDTYREKTAKLAKHFKSLTQIHVTGACKDIDEFLKKGGDLTALLESAQPTEVSDVEVEGGKGDSNVIIKDGMYHKVVYKDGEESLRPLTNFVIELLNVFVTPTENGVKRMREIVIVLPNGRRSVPFLVDSDSKTSIRQFKTLAANAIDASVYGTDSDLTAIWEKVIDCANDKEVLLLEKSGRLDSHSGWLFKDCFIADSGDVIHPDKRGVMWLTSTNGIKPVSIEVGGGQRGVPRILTKLDKAERKEVTNKAIHALADNIGNMAEALTIFGWCMATAHSIRVFDHFGFFPHLQFWGTQGKGKTYIIKMLLDIFNMEDNGYTGINSLNSGVAFSRKMSSYYSLPMCIDEIRNDDITGDWYGSFRQWYNREGRAVGSREGNGVKTSEVNSTIIFGGEDQFEDPATRARVIPIRMRQNNRELVHSFKVMESIRGDMNAIGFEWITEYGKVNETELKADFDAKEKYFRDNGVEARQARNWAAVGVFANKLALEYCPEFDYLTEILQLACVNQEEQQADTTLLQFWDAIESMQVGDRPMITAEVIKRDGTTLYVWYKTVYDLFKQHHRDDRNKFSKNAILTSLKEEEYYLREARTSFGMSNVTRRCIALNLELAPESVQNIASYLDA